MSDPFARLVSIEHAQQAGEPLPVAVIAEHLKELQVPAFDLPDRRWAWWIVDCAERVLPIFEASRPQDVRPREGIRAARQVIAGHSYAAADTSDAAAAAAYAAADTSDAVAAAVYAAADASDAAAAYAVSDAAYAASDAAAAAAAAYADQRWRRRWAAAGLSRAVHAIAWSQDWRAAAREQLWQVARLLELASMSDEEFEALAQEGAP